MKTTKLKTTLVSLVDSPGICITGVDKNKIKRNIRERPASNSINSFNVNLESDATLNILFSNNIILESNSYIKYQLTKIN